MDIKEESLKKALTAVRIPELPKQFREEYGEHWLEAIVLVKKRDGSLSYAVADRATDGKIRYKADYGTMSQIAGLVSIHPYTYLDREKYMPDGDIEHKRDVLVRFIGGDSDAEEAVSAMTDEEVEAAVISIAVETQYSNKSVNATHDKIIASVKGEKPQPEHKVSGTEEAEGGQMEECGTDTIEEDTVNEETQQAKTVPGEKRRRVTIRRSSTKQQ